MSLPKVILILALSGIVFFVLMLVYALSPAVSNVSDNDELRYFANKMVTLKRQGILYSPEPADYAFTPYVLSDNQTYPWKKNYLLSAGSNIIIREFKTYKNAISGSTYLYAIGEWDSPEGKKIAFEYLWGSITSPGYLPHAIWQDSTETRIWF